MEKIYDMIVIGGGPAGYTAALYAARSGLSVLVLEKLSAGGQMALTEQIDNYPGFESGIDGFTLGEKMQQSAERFGAVTELAEVYKVSLSGKIKTLETSEGVFQGRTVVIATHLIEEVANLVERVTIIDEGRVLMQASADELRELIGFGRTRRGIFEGDLEEGELEIGQIASLIRDLPSAGEIVASLVEEFNARRAALPTL